MSLCTLIPNQDKINHYYQEIENKTKDFDSGWRVVDYVMKSLLLEQWLLRRKYYNSKMLDKHKFEITVTGKNYLNCLFQHIYNHNHNTIVDECYEIDEAYNKFMGINEEGKCYDVVNEDDYYKCLSLWVEEIIDCLFFTLEQTIFIETSHLLTLLNFNFNSYNIYDFLTDKPNVYKNENEIFNERIKIMLEAEGSHLTTWFYHNKECIKGCENNYGGILNTLKANRECLRQTKWKDWQDWSENMYDAVRFGNMFKANRNLYIPVLNMLYHKLNQYAIDIMKIKDYNAENHISHMFKVVYALYMTKRDENIRRQMEDKRYNNDVTDNKIVGVDV